MTTNLLECFNGVLKGACNLPIIAMVRFTFFKVNLYFDARHNLTLDQLEVSQEWCKYATDKFKKNQVKAKEHMVIGMCTQVRLYQVDTLSNPMSDGGGQHTHKVDFWGMTCTCGKWEACKILCSHVIAICAKYKHNAQQFIDPCYSMPKWYHSYKLVFQPLKDRLAWPNPEETRLVMPNSRLIQNKGQPVFTRICNEMDEDDRELSSSLWIENGQKSRCGLYRQKGHNRKTCPTQNAESTSSGAASQVKLPFHNNFCHINHYVTVYKCFLTWLKKRYYPLTKQ